MGRGNTSFGLHFQGGNKFVFSESEESCYSQGKVSS